MNSLSQDREIGKSRMRGNEKEKVREGKGEVMER